MKKVLVVNTVGFYVNGITTVIMNYYNNMNDYELEFVSASQYDKTVEDAIKKRRDSYYYMHRKKNPLKYMFWLYKLCKEKNFDVIHVHGNSALMVIDLLPAKLAGVRIRIAQCHNSFCDHKVMHKILKPLFHKLYTKAVACSDLAGEWIFGKDNYVILNNAIQVEQYVFNQAIREKYRRLFQLCDDDIVLGHVGLCNSQKNKIFLIELMRQMKTNKKIKLFLVGDGDNTIKKNILEKIEEYNLENDVFLMGTRDDVIEIMHAMDIFLFPSLWEGFGIALLEAQATGLPCIASENVPKSVNISEKVRYVHLDAKDEWIENIEKISQTHTYSRITESKSNIVKICDSGYDIKTQTDILRKIYG